MTTILSKEADVHLITISACNEQVTTGIIMPEGSYGESLAELRKYFSDEEIYEGLKMLREIEKDREKFISLSYAYRV